MPVGNYPKNVTVIVRANTEEITSVHASQIRAYVNIDHITKGGEYTVPVNVSASQAVLFVFDFAEHISPKDIRPFHLVTLACLIHFLKGIDLDVCTIGVLFYCYHVKYFLYARLRNFFIRSPFGL